MSIQLAEISDDAVGVFDGFFGDDVDFIAGTDGMRSGIQINIYKYVIENKPQFDGRFFIIREKKIFVELGFRHWDGFHTWNSLVFEPAR